MSSHRSVETQLPMVGQHLKVLEQVIIRILTQTAQELWLDSSRRKAVTEVPWRTITHNASMVSKRSMTIFIRAKRRKMEMELSSPTTWMQQAQLQLRLLKQTQIPLPSKTRVKFKYQLMLWIQHQVTTQTCKLNLSLNLRSNRSRDNPTRDLMHTKHTNLQIKMICLFSWLMNWTSAGKLIHASIKSTTLIMAITVKLSIWPRLQQQQKQTMLRFSEKVKNSRQHTPKCKIYKRNT